MKFKINRINFIRKIYTFFLGFGINLKKIYNFIHVFQYIKDYIKFKNKGGQINGIYPFLENFNIVSNEHKHQFFHADLLVSKKIYDSNPSSHLDIGSRVDGLVAHLASFRKLDFLDVRSVDTSPHDSINFIKKNIMNLDISNFDKKYDSISSIGVISHVGLGRYGDEIDPLGHIKAMKNITKLLNKNGTIYIMVPVGKKRVEFNAHRVFAPEDIIDFFNKNGCKFIEFSLVDDDGNLHVDCDLQNSKDLNFGGGIFVFKN
jgi:hypothetical protein|tara:strand:+ start:132 stop:911 length:780 start_codon:yes stop_codon:yes gene_type:complete